MTISIHALLAESDAVVYDIVFMPREFLSTLSLRRATPERAENHANSQFLSTLSLRRATGSDSGISCKTAISIHALLAESDNRFIASRYLPAAFLSTLSLRRATRRPCKERGALFYFYPRSPCGERRESLEPIYKYIHNFYPRSPCGERRLPSCPLWRIPVISIHALLAESDPLELMTVLIIYDFYPRSPCGERLSSGSSSMS